MHEHNRRPETDEEQRLRQSKEKEEKKTRTRMKEEEHYLMRSGVVTELQVVAKRLSEQKGSDYVTCSMTECDSPQITDIPVDVRVTWNHLSHIVDDRSKDRQVFTTTWDEIRCHVVRRKGTIIGVQFHNSQRAIPISFKKSLQADLTHAITSPHEGFTNDLGQDPRKYRNRRKMIDR